MTFTEILGYTAGAITAFTFLPQVIKTWKEKSAKNVALAMFIIAFINEAMWIAYGILEKNWVIISTNVVMIIMCSIMIALKLKYKNV